MLRLSNLRLTRLFLHSIFLFKKYYYFFLLLILVVVISFGVSLVSGYLSKLKVKPNDLLTFLNDTNDVLDNQAGVTNFLLLGIRGEGSDSPNLSDTMIFFSYDKNKQSLTQISIPRDIWVPSLRDRINTAYHYGEEASPGGGLKMVEASIFETLGQPVNYTAIISFDLFKKIIDLVDGVDVYVSPGFIDKEFPIPGKENSYPLESRYETITFNEGLNHFNGETALKFVRSRHSIGDQGTDFARSQRQQKVISALKDKLISSDILLSREKIDQLILLVQQNLITNISPSLYPSLAKIALNLNQNQLKTIILDTKPDAAGVSILYNPPISKLYDNKWVLLPKDNNWKALKQYIENSLKVSN